jgi:hypothetical protein
LLFLASAPRRIIIGLDIDVLGTAPDLIGQPTSVEQEVAKGNLQPAAAPPPPPTNHSVGALYSC